MDMEKALTIITNASQSYRGTLADHNQIQSALSVIKEAVAKNDKKTDKDKK